MPVNIFRRRQAAAGPNGSKRSDRELRRKSLHPVPPPPPSMCWNAFSGSICLAVNVRAVKLHVSLRSCERAEAVRAVKFVGVAGDKHQAAQARKVGVRQSVLDEPSAQATAAMRLKHVNVAEVGKSGPVGDKAGETDLGIALGGVKTEAEGTSHRPGDSLARDTLGPVASGEKSVNRFKVKTRGITGKRVAIRSTGSGDRRGCIHNGWRSPEPSPTSRIRPRFEKSFVDKLFIFREATSRKRPKVPVVKTYPIHRQVKIAIISGRHVLAQQNADERRQASPPLEHRGEPPRGRRQGASAPCALPRRN